MITRRMIVTRAPGYDTKAMIKLANRWLNASGFEIGTAIEVQYKRGIITIKKVKNDYEQQNNVLQQEPIDPLADSAAATASGAGITAESDEYAGRGAPAPQGTAADVRESAFPARLVLRGQWSFARS